MNRRAECPSKQPRGVEALKNLLTLVLNEGMASTSPPLADVAVAEPKCSDASARVAALIAGVVLVIGLRQWLARQRSIQGVFAAMTAVGWVIYNTVGWTVGALGVLLFVAIALFFDGGIADRRQ
jgi:hypothetical protein